MAARTAAALARFEAGMDDDLNTAEALAAVFEYIREINSAMDSGEFLAGNVAAAIKTFWLRSTASLRCSCPPSKRPAV